MNLKDFLEYLDQFSEEDKNKTIDAFIVNEEVEALTFKEDKNNNQT